MSELGSYSGKTITSKTLQAPTLSIDYSNLSQNNQKTSFNNKTNSSISVEADLSEFLEEFEETNTENVNNMQFATGAVAGGLGLKETELEAEKPWYEKLWDSVKETAATVAVTTTSIVSGIADIAEGLADGVAWTGGKLVEGASWLVGETAGLIDEDAKEDIMSWREDFKKGTKDFIATDWVGEANKAFYEGTDIGRSINDASYMKYDSDLAKGITNASEMVGKIAIATVATVATGGAAAPVATGFLFGVGDKAEKVYQSGEATGAKEELGIFISGVGEAANWYALGKLGQGATQLAGVVKNNGVKNTASTVFNSIKTTLKNTKAQGLSNTLKSLYNSTKGILSNTSYKSLLTSDNLSDSIGIIGDNTSRWLTGEEEFNFKTAAQAGGELLMAWGLNSLFDAAGDYLTHKGKAGGGSKTPTSSHPEPHHYVSSVPTSAADEVIALNKNIEVELKALDPTDPLYAKKVSLIQSKAEIEAQLLDSVHSRGITMGDYIKQCGGINQLDDATQAVVNQSAHDVFVRAQQAEGSISKTMMELQEEGVAKLQGFDHRFKSEESIARKISAWAQGSTSPSSIAYYADQINDSLRYTLILDDASYTSKMYESLRKLTDQGYQISYINNSWGSSVYQGINVSLISPDGLPLELQFHTDSSFYTKEVINHELYEISRSPISSVQERQAAAQIMAINQQLNVQTINDLAGVDGYEIAANVAKYSPTSPRVYKKYNTYEEFVEAQKRATKRWKNGLSKKELEYFRNYIGEAFYAPGNYMSVNGISRNNIIDFNARTINLRGTFGYDSTIPFDDLMAYHNMTIDDFINMQTDAAISLNNAISRTGLAADTVLYRGMNYNALAAYGVKPGDSASEIFACLTRNGDTFSDSGFMSCAPTLDIGITSSKPILLQMNCKKGLPAADLSFINSYEQEVLLGMGTEFFIDSVVEENGQIIINLTSK